MSTRTLRTMWEEYASEEQKGIRSQRCYELEAEIHTYQKMVGVSPYDFDSRWAKRDQIKKEMIQMPSLEPAPVQITIAPQRNFDYDTAKKIIGENNDAIIADCVRWAEAWVVCASFHADQVNPSNQNNPARRGQIMNFARQEYLKRKEDDPSAT